MRYALGMPFNSCPPNDEFLVGDALVRVAQAAEEAGFSAVYFTDHPAPGEDWRQQVGHDALDPFVALSFVAAATSTVRLLTSVIVLPYRNPLLLAKTIASLDRLSDGRFTLGVGTGYLQSEYNALGVDFDERNALFDESVEVMKLAWSGRPVTYAGRNFTADEVTVQPTPSQHPNPPIWLGGNSERTRRRVAEWGDGWMPMPNPGPGGDTRRSPPLRSVADLERMLVYMSEHAAAVGRSTPIDVMYMTFEGGLPGAAGFNRQVHVEAIHELDDIGVNWLAAHVAGDSCDEIVENIAAYGDQIIAA